MRGCRPLEGRVVITLSHSMLQKPETEQQEKNFILNYASKSIELSTPTFNNS